MSIYNNRYLRFFISFLLIFAITLNFSLKPKADLVLGGLTIKLIATVLAGMGVLATVQNNGGVESFKNGLAGFMESVKGVQNAHSLIVSIAKDSIINKVKIGASNIVSYVKEFYNSWRAEKMEHPKFESLGNVTLEKSFELSTRPRDVPSIFPNDLTSDYSVHLGKNIYLIPFLSYPGDIPYINVNFVELQSDGSLVELSSSRLKPAGSFAEYDHYVHVDLKYQYSSVDNKLLLYIGHYNTTYDQPNWFYKTKIFDVPDFWLDMPVIETGGSLPVGGSVSGSLDFPWQLGGSISHYPGMTKEDLVNDISNADIKAYIDKALELERKKIIDSIPAPDVVLEGEKVITIEYPDISDIIDGIEEGVGEQTGILKKILEKIGDIFVTEEVTPINFNPIMDINVKDKFPFSLPWDLKESYNILIRPPKPVKFTVPIVTEKITVDFQQFDKWAFITRSFLSVIFIIGLVILTRRFIGGA